MAERAASINSERVKAVFEMVHDLQEMLTSALKVREAFETDLKEMRSRLTQVKGENESLQGKLGAAREEIEKLGNPEKEIDYLEDEIRGINQKIRNLMLEARGCNNRIKELELTIDQDERTNQKIQGELDNLEDYYYLRQKERDKLEERIDQVIHEKNELLREIREIDENMNSLKDVGSTMDEVVSVLTETVSSVKVGFYGKNKK